MNQNSYFFKYPEIGSKVKCSIIKTSFAQVELKIEEVDGFKTPVYYRALLKGSSVGEEVYLSDKVQRSDVIDCIVVSYSDKYIVVSQL